MTWPTGAVETRGHESNADVAGVGGTVLDATDQNWVYDLLERLQIKVGSDTDDDTDPSLEGRLKAIEALGTPLTNPLTTPGDLLRGGTAGAPTRLGIGTTNQVLTVVSGLPVWADAATGDASTITTPGDLEYGAVTTGDPTRLPIGSAGQVLGVAGGVPAWITPAYIADPSGAPVGAGLMKDASSVWSYVAPGTSGYVLTSNGPGAMPSYQVIPISSPGTGITTPTGIHVGGVPMYDEFGAWIALNPGTAGQVLTAHGDGNVAGSKLTWTTPSSGFTSPMTTLSDIIIATTGGAPARLGIGSTNQVLTVVAGAPVWATWNPMTTLDDIIIGGASGVAARLTKGSNGQVLTISSSGHVVWQNSASGFADPETTIGDLIHRNASNVTARLPIGATGEVLTVVSGVPAWAAATGGGGGGGGSRFSITTDGLIADFDFSHKADATLSNTADADGWQVRTTLDAGTWIFRNGRLVNTGHGNYDRVSNMAISQRDGVYEVHLATPSAAGHYVGHEFLITSGANTNYNTLNRTADRQLLYRAAGSDSNVSVGANFAAVSNEVFSVKTKFTFPGSTRTLSHWLNNVLMFAGTSGAGPTTAGGIGLQVYPNGSGLDTEFLRYSVYADTVVTVTGLAGTQAWRLYAAGGTLIGSSGAQSGGSASVDTALACLMPLWGHLQMFTSTSYATPESGASRWPAEGEGIIWGGRVFAWT